MREILFRGQMLYGKKFIEGSLLLMNGKSYIHQGCGDRHDIDFGYSFEEVKPKTVGQYIGLKDKNGVKIFENGYLAWEEEDPFGQVFASYREMVSKQSDGLYILLPSGQSISKMLSVYSLEFHDNPELTE